MLDDLLLLAQRDPSNALGIVEEEHKQAAQNFVINNPSDNKRKISNIIVTGMGGSTLAALLFKELFFEKLKIPFEIVRDYDLPLYVGKETLVIASSYSGNTEETISGLNQALNKNAICSVISSGGKLIELAKKNKLSYCELPGGLEPRYGVIFNLKALYTLLQSHGLVSREDYKELENTANYLKVATQSWQKAVPLKSNLAKQLAVEAAGKTAVIYSSTIMQGVSYKWKISWNENAKNLAFSNVFPEMNHNEFIGWTSHPIDKPFIVFDLRSSFDNSRIQKRFEITDRLLSGKRPKSINIKLEGKTLVEQMLYGSILADYVSVYLAILNHVDPTPVALVEKLKQELAN